MIIGGIQQIGIGVDNADRFFDWYKSVFDIDIKLFDDEAEATLMTRYTSGEVRTRRAIYAINLQGGGGLEIWQYKNQEPKKSDFAISVGDLGLFAAKMKTRNVEAFHSKLSGSIDTWISPILTAPDGSSHFYLKDPDGNLFNLSKGNRWFKDEGKLSGGVVGSMLGVSDMEKSISYYKDYLNFDSIVYDESGHFEDLSVLEGGNRNVRRVLLTRSSPGVGPFGKLLGNINLELVQLLEDSPRKIFEGRDWGDKGFIHICYDVANMDVISEAHISGGRELTVDSGKSFDMGDAAGRFSYAEDPDGTLIEMVETKRIPLYKPFKLFFTLSDKHRQFGVPNWIIRAFKFSRVK